MHVWKVLINLKPSAAIRRNADGRQIQFCGCAHPSDRIQHGVGADLLAAFQPDDDPFVLRLVDRDHLFVEEKRDADVAHLILQGLDDL